MFKDVLLGSVAPVSIILTVMQLSFNIYQMFPKHSGNLHKLISYKISATLFK